MFEKYKLVWINVILIPNGEGCMQFKKCYGPLMWAYAKNQKSWDKLGQISKTTFYKEETEEL